MLMKLNREVWGADAAWLWISNDSLPSLEKKKTEKKKTSLINLGMSDAAESD